MNNKIQEIRTLYNAGLYNYLYSRTIGGFDFAVKSQIGNMFYKSNDFNKAGAAAYPGEFLEQRTELGLTDIQDLRAMAVYIVSFEAISENILQKRQKQDFLTDIKEHEDNYLHIIYGAIEKEDFLDRELDHNQKLFSVCFLRDIYGNYNVLNQWEPQHFSEYDIQILAMACSFFNSGIDKQELPKNWKKWFSELGKLYYSAAKESNTLIKEKDDYLLLLSTQIEMTPYYGSFSQQRITPTTIKFARMIVRFLEGMFAKEEPLTEMEKEYCERLVKKHQYPVIAVNGYHNILQCVYKNNIECYVKSNINLWYYFFLCYKYIERSYIHDVYEFHHSFDYPQDIEAMEYIWNVIHKQKNSKSYASVKWDIYNSISFKEASKELILQFMEWLKSVQISATFQDFSEKNKEYLLDKEIFSLEEAYELNKEFTIRYCGKLRTDKAAEFYINKSMFGEIAMGKYMLNEANISTEWFRKIMDGEGEYVFHNRYKLYSDYLRFILCFPQMALVYSYEERKELFLVAKELEEQYTDFGSTMDWLKYEVLEKTYYSKEEYEILEKKRNSQKENRIREKKLKEMENRYQDNGGGWNGLVQVVDYIWNDNKFEKEFVFQKLNYFSKQVSETDIICVWEILLKLMKKKWFTVEEAKSFFGEFEVLNENQKESQIQP